MTEFIKGMDISSLTEVESLGGAFFDGNVKLDLFDLLKKYNTNSIRLRLWNNPFSEDGSSYLGGYCDLQSILKLSERAHMHGMSVLLDFQYSDFWADPGKQYKPKAWENLKGLRLEKALYDYTFDTLKHFRDKKILPEYIQIGNEITNGFLWPDGKLEPNPNGGARLGFDRLAGLLRSAIKAVREISPLTKIVLHLERSGDNAIYREWHGHILVKEHIDCDIIGVSYYVYWHGPIENFASNIKDVQARYKKPVMLVETSFGFTGEEYETKLKPENFTGLVMTDKKFESLDKKPPYTLSIDGQNAFMKKLLTTINDLGIIGLYYWEPAWLPLRGSSWASESAIRYIHEIKGVGNEWANQGLFDYQGHVLPAMKIIKEFKFKGVSSL
ncbi:MAG: glycosyl hydrolase 53 family protein [Firmicutes bacterium]|nr:glycosyl hydrolase 53 family protein [Bacillota bacterium]